MDTLVQANIFFFITSIAVVGIAIALVVVLILLIQILRDARHVSRRVREESDRVISDIEHVRRFVREEGKKAIDLKEFVGGVVGAFLPKRRFRRRKKNETTE